MAAPSDESGEDEGRCDGVAAAHLAESLVLVGLHLRRVIAPLCHADGGTHAVGGRCLQKIIEAIEAFDVAKLHQLRGSI
jgi:hypothetical protein